ncbi:MAG: hypothetical protein Q9195_004375 [Heterodermia aff. obscurata]
MDEPTNTAETPTTEERNQDGTEYPDPTRLSEIEYTSLKEWLERHYSPLRLCKRLSSLLSKGDKEAKLKDCQAQPIDWLQEIYDDIRPPLHNFPTQVHEWLLTQTRYESEQTGETSGDLETQSPLYRTDMLRRLIRTLELERTRDYEKDHGGPVPSPVKYECNKCEQDLWLREKDPLVCYWCKHRVIRKAKSIIMATPPPPRTQQIAQCLTSINLSELQPSDRTCAICHEAFHDQPPQAGEALAANPPEQHVKLLQCRHVFGKDCITCWLTEHDDCPMCRAAIIFIASNRDKLDLHHLLRRLGQLWDRHLQLLEELRQIQDTPLRGNGNEEHEGREESPVSAPRRLAVD